MWQRPMRRIVCVDSVVRYVAALACSFMTAGALAQDPIPGSLHTPGFANGSFPIGTSNDVANAVALHPDGKIVLVGGCEYTGGNSDICVARLNSDGTLDVSFDGPTGTGNGKFTLPIGLIAEIGSASAVVIQPDGKIVIAGTCNITGNDFCVARLNPNGTLDVSFDGPSGTGNGVVLLPIGSGNDRATTVAVQPDGNIVLAGLCANSGGFYDFCAARLNPDGTLDASFDGPSGTGNGKFLLPIGTSDDFATAVVIQPDGKIVLAGYCSSSGYAFCIARLNPDGTLDASFDGPLGTGNGKFLVQIATINDYAYAVALQPDGKIVLAGTCLVSGGPDFCVARLNPDGTLDASFDGPTGTANGKVLLPIGGGADTATSLALQPDGKIVIAGQCANGSVASFCLARLHSDGSLDTSFDGSSALGNGKFLLSISVGIDGARAIALQPDGRIVLAGTCSNGSNDDFCVARLNGGPFGAKHCTMDIDGDGRVLATVDGLISTRVMLGVTGSAVVGGVVFPANATRNNWPLIRNYLVTQCGITLAP